MGVRTRGLDIKAGAAKLKADRAAREEAGLVRRSLEPAGHWPRHAMVANDQGRAGRRDAASRSRVLNLGRLANPTARMPNAANAIRDVIVHAIGTLLRRRSANSTK
jgi:hypothetical protein